MENKRLKIEEESQHFFKFKKIFFFPKLQEGTVNKRRKGKYDDKKYNRIFLYMICTQ